MLTMLKRMLAEYGQRRNKFSTGMQGNVFYKLCVCACVHVCVCACVCVKKVAYFSMEDQWV